MGPQEQPQRGQEDTERGCQPNREWRVPGGRHGSLGSRWPACGEWGPLRAGRGITIAEKVLELEWPAVVCLSGVPLCFSVGQSSETSE